MRRILVSLWGSLSNFMERLLKKRLLRRFLKKQRRLMKKVWRSKKNLRGFLKKLRKSMKRRF